MQVQAQFLAALLGPAGEQVYALRPAETASASDNGGPVQPMGAHDQAADRKGKTVRGCWSPRKGPLATPRKPQPQPASQHRLARINRRGVLALPVTWQQEAEAWGGASRPGGVAWPLSGRDRDPTSRPRFSRRYEECPRGGTGISVAGRGAVGRGDARVVARLGAEGTWKVLRLPTR